MHLIAPTDLELRFTAGKYRVNSRVMLATQTDANRVIVGTPAKLHGHDYLLTVRNKRSISFLQRTDLFLLPQPIKQQPMSE